MAGPAGAALTTQSAQLVRQKAYEAVYASGTVTTGGSPSPQSPLNFLVFKALFIHLATTKGNPDLQFVPFGDVDLTAATGYSPITGACTLYAAYCKSRSAPTTGSYFVVNDANGPTGNTITATSNKVTNAFSTGGNQSFFWVNGNGTPIANSLSVASLTLATPTGVASATGNGGDGFCIVSA